MSKAYEKVSGTFFDLLRPTSGPERRFQAQLIHRGFRPRGIANRAASLDAPSHRRQFGIYLRIVHMVHPVGLARDRPGCNQLLVLSRSTKPAIETSPAPVLRPRC